MGDNSIVRRFCSTDAAALIPEIVHRDGGLCRFDVQVSITRIDLKEQKC